MTDESRILKTNRYPLVNVYITMENQPLLMGKLAISVAIVSSFFCMFTRPGRPYRSNKNSPGRGTAADVPLWVESLGESSMLYDISYII